jgi:superfamily I DNA/RNA helicase
MNYQDEEKLFYVAITRAEEQFYILYDKEPSPFIGKLKRKDEQSN